MKTTRPRRLYLAWAPNTEMTPVPVRSPFLRPCCMMYSIWSRYPRSSHRTPKFFFSGAAIFCLSSSFLQPLSVCISEVAGIFVENKWRRVRSKTDIEIWSISQESFPGDFDADTPHWTTANSRCGLLPGWLKKRALYFFRLSLHKTQPLCCRSFFYR